MNTRELRPSTRSTVADVAAKDTTQHENDLVMSASDALGSH